MNFTKIDKKSATIVFAFAAINIIALIIIVAVARRDNTSPNTNSYPLEIYQSESLQYEPISDASTQQDLLPPTVIFSHTGGLFTEPFYLDLSTSTNVGQIFFTTDGSIPKPDSSFEYTAPIFVYDRSHEPNVLSAIPAERIGCFIVYWQEYFVPPTDPVFKGTVIRAQVFDENGNALSPIATHSFFVCDNVFERYASLPVISLVTDYANLFCDEIGIYVRGHNNQGGYGADMPTPNWEQRGREWERPVSVEMFEVDGTSSHQAVAMDMGMRIHGGGTRRLAQKSFRLYARSDYDMTQSTLSHDIFQGAAVDKAGETITEFNRLLLRNFGNEGSSTMIRDAGLQYLSRNLNVDIQAYRPAIVFINGEFWGLYNIRERMDDRFIASYYHIDRNSVAMLTLGASTGWALDFGRQRDLSDFIVLEQFFYENNFEGSYNDDFITIQNYMCLDSFIDHYIANLYFGNIDWPNNNVRIWRYFGETNSSEPGRDGRWRWMLFDLDSTAGFNFSLPYDIDPLHRILELPELRTPMRGDEFAIPESTLMFRRLMENSDFRQKFIARFEYVMDNHFTEELFIEMVETFSERIRPVVHEQIDRFGRIRTFEEWEAELQHLRDFGTRRRAYMEDFLNVIR